MNAEKLSALMDKESKPDVAHEASSAHSLTLNKVGMDAVELPLNITDELGRMQAIPAKCDLYVSLDDPKAKGIHMSRLYLKAQEYFAKELISFDVLANLSRAFIESHEGLSNSAYIRVAFDFMVQRSALKSRQKGWRFYPVEMIVSNKNGKIDFDFNIEITYSSTCPCSAALSRQLNQKSFLLEFANKETLDKEEVSKWLLSLDAQTAVPHAQRSKAHVLIRFDKDHKDFNILEVINFLEEALDTPVQAAVKREDEQEFARLNGSNMMFSEDACRRVKNILEERQYLGYRVKVEHLESLHPHNAVAIAEKNL